MKNKTVCLLDLMPDECADYIDGTEDFSSLLKPMQVTHRWCPETREMQPLRYFKAKFDKEVERLYTDFGGEA